jgi:hypothetical protein
MIPYLKNRDFADLTDAPKINAEGKFFITPERPEWGAWREHFRLGFSDAAADRFDARKSFLSDDRWPPNFI